MIWVLAAVLLGLFQLFSTFLLFHLVKRLIDAKQADLERRAEAVLQDWLVAEEGKASKAAALVDAMGAVIGSAAARSLMLSLNQQAGANANVANGISERLQAQQNPIMALLAGGKRGKGAAVLRLAEMLGPLLGGGGKPSAGNGHQGELFDVHKYG